MKKTILFLTAILAFSQGALSQSPVAWWRLNNNTDDSSGGGVTGTLMNGPVYSTDAKEGSHSIQLDGINDYIDLGNPQTLPSGTSARSISAWAKTNRVSGFRWIASFGTASSSSAMFIGQNGTQLRGGGFTSDVIVNNFWEVGVWRHICLTYDGTTAKLYADGVLVASAAKSWNLALLRAYIGRQVNNSEYWDGLIDDVRIYNVALSATEVQALVSQPPAAPNLLSASSTAETLVTLTWNDNATNETGFAVERSLISGSSFNVIDTVGADVTTFTDSGLTSNTTYYYRVRAINSGGSSAYTSEASVTTLSIPAAPTGLSASANSSSAVNLTWTDVSSNESGFQIERSITSGSGFTLVGTTLSNAVSHEDMDLEPATTYYYRIRAINAVGNSSYSSEVSVATLIQIPAAPGGLGATAVSSASINLYWTDNSADEVEFEIERSENLASGFELIGVVAENTVMYSDTSLTSGIAYYYRVRATNSGGYSAFSSVTSATTLPVEGGTQLCQSIYCNEHGGVGIGTPHVPQGFMLAVKGKMMAEGVKIALESAWPDYVFAKGYNLKDIPTLKKFIDENGHLPNIPAASIVEKEGIDVGQINVLLLEKIEELSLYLIEMEERINRLESENKQLRKRSTTIND